MTPTRHAPVTAPALGTLRRVRAGVLDVAFCESGSPDGPAVLLMHGFPYDVHAYEAVAPLLADAGCRVIVPYLRGYGATHFVDEATPRSGEQAALGADLLALMYALHVGRAVLAGYDWGGRACCVVAALWPERCAGLLSGNGYNLQHIAAAGHPATPENEHRHWYQYYFQTERGHAGLQQHRDALCRMLWQQWSPTWTFDDATFARSAAAFAHPDFVEVAIHSYRHRHQHPKAPGDPAYAAIEARLAAQPDIRVPAITLDGADDGVMPVDGTASHSHHFTGPHAHRVIAQAGHNLPQEQPQAFARAVLHLVGGHPPETLP